MEKEREKRKVWLASVIYQDIPTFLHIFVGDEWVSWPSFFLNFSIHWWLHLWSPVKHKMVSLPLGGLCGRRTIKRVLWWHAGKTGLSAGGEKKEKEKKRNMWKEKRSELERFSNYYPQSVRICSALFRIRGQKNGWWCIEKTHGTKLENLITSREQYWDNNMRMLINEADLISVQTLRAGKNGREKKGK